MAIFGDFAARYHDMGYNVLPLRPMTKRPFSNGWSEWCHRKQQSFQVDSWASSHADFNIGIVLGEASGIIALDFDNDVNGLHAKIEALVPGSPARKKGNKGYTSFYRFNGERAKKWYKDDKAVVEILSTGNQTVVPPSIHPDTKQAYTWLSEDTLLDLNPSDLPLLPDDFIAKVDAIMGYNIPITSIRSTSSFTASNDEEKQVEDALSFIPSQEYSMWINIGMALHHSFGQKGFDLWDSWSRKAPNYDAAVMQRKWDSFGKRADVVTIATIYHYAVGYGYIMPTPQPEFDIAPGFQVVVSDPQSDQSDIKVTNETNHFPQHLLNAPGLPGRIAQWINSTAIKRQPILALGAAITAAGTIMAHRYRSPSNLRTNFMALGVAESASGKEHARDCIDSLFTYCNIGQYILGDFASDAGILTAVYSNRGIALAMIDELGRELRSLGSRNVGSHESRILTTLMKIWSKSGGVYRGKQYANHDGTMDRKDIQQPCLSIYGTTVPKRLYDALTTDDAIDGFLARWLIFASEDIAPPLQTGGDIYLPPEPLANEIKLIQEQNPYGHQRLDISNIKADQPAPQPLVVDFSGEAERLLHDFTQMVDDLRIKEIKSGGVCAPIWGRAREHCIKLALVAHEPAHGLIESVSMGWATKLTLHLCQQACNAVKSNISDTQHGALVIRIQGIIRRYNERNGAPMPHRAFAQCTSFIDMAYRTKILTQLVEAGMVEAQEVQVGDRKSYQYLVV